MKRKRKKKGGGGGSSLTISPISFCVCMKGEEGSVLTKTMLIDATSNKLHYAYLYKILLNSTTLKKKIKILNHF